jgi:hypothetical protein
MRAESTALLRFGAWGQVVVIAFAMVFWFLGVADGFLASCIGYLVITTVGIAGMARTESTVAGPFFYPFIVPGFVPLYYFATRKQSSADE